MGSRTRADQVDEADGYDYAALVPSVRAMYSLSPFLSKWKCSSHIKYDHLDFCLEWIRDRSDPSSTHAFAWQRYVLVTFRMTSLSETSSFMQVSLSSSRR